MGRETDEVDRVRKAVREQVKAGADFIEIVATPGDTSQEGDADGCFFN